MELTSGWFITLLISVTLALTVMILIFWQRLGAVTWLTVLARILSVAAVNALVIVCTLAVLNDQYQFYVTWGDLFGESQTATAQVTYTGAAPSTVYQGWNAPFPLTVPSGALPPLRTSGASGRGLSYTIHGQMSGLTGKVMVIVPPGYSSASSGHYRYPVILMPPTFPGTPASLLHNVDLIAASRRAITNGDIRPAIIVSAQAWFPPGAPDSECVNWPNGPQVEEWMSHDVPQWLANHFPVVLNRDSWATFGFSAGGYCASVTAMLHPDVFATAISLGGYFTPSFAGVPAFEPGSADFEYYNLVRRAAQQPPAVAMLVETSAGDKLSAPSSTALVRAARSPLSVQGIMDPVQGHRFSVWSPLLGPVFSWLGRTAPGFRITPAGTGAFNSP